jgi:hypothetical protein
MNRIPDDATPFAHRDAMFGASRTTARLDPIVPGDCLVALHIVSTWPVPRTAPDVHDAHKPRVVIDREENAIDVRLASVAQYPDGMIWIDALGRSGTAVRMMVE